MPPVVSRRVFFFEDMGRPPFDWLWEPAVVITGFQQHGILLDTGTVAGACSRRAVSAIFILILNKSLSFVSIVFYCLFPQTMIITHHLL